MTSVTSASKLERDQGAGRRVREEEPTCVRVCVREKHLYLSTITIARSLTFAGSRQPAPPPHGALLRGSLARPRAPSEWPEPAPNKSDLRISSTLNVLQAGRRDRAAGSAAEGSAPAVPLSPGPSSSAPTEAATVRLAWRSATCVRSPSKKKCGGRLGRGDARMGSSWRACWARRPPSRRRRRIGSSAASRLHHPVVRTHS